MKPTEITVASAKPSHDEIALAAYLAWEKDGRPAGRDAHYWQQAEAHLNAKRAAAAAPAAAKIRRSRPAARLIAATPAKLNKLTSSGRKAATTSKAVVARKRKASR